MTRIYDIANDYVERYADLDPIAASRIGIAGHDEDMTDFSPDGFARFDDLDRDTIRDLQGASPDNDADRIARDVMLERLNVRLANSDAGERYLSVRTLGSVIGSIRSVFDQMPRATADEWSRIATRLEKVPHALEQHRATLDEGIAKLTVAAKRQVVECARQAETWSGAVAGTPSFFSTLLDAFDRSGVSDEKLRSRIAAATQSCDAAYAGFSTYLTQVYMPKARDNDSTPESRYQLGVRSFLGTEIDIAETYAWAWDELHRLEREMEITAEKILPGGGVEAARKALDDDPAKAIEGVEQYREWLQVMHDDALDKLDGVHFEIDPRIRRVEVMIPPPGGALAAFYTGPSEDFSRPGRTWFPVGQRTRFPKWTDVTTVYHEGVPGHHLQVGATKCLGLSRYQKTMGFVSGHGEGWALYAERLMAELGFLDVPDYYMGMLSMQALRAVRVIIDIGMHLELKIPASEKFHPGETWGHDLAVAFTLEKTGINEELVRSEILRYLGWPAQAISYKVGERRWLAARDSAKARRGAAFDLKQFHTQALGLGPMGLAQLERELAALG